MDPLFKPVMTLIPPFIVAKYSDRKEDAKNPRYLNDSKKPFEFDSQYFKQFMTERNFLPNSK